MFGENLTISDLDETTICVGDVYQLGNSLVEVTKPREPCFKLIFRFQNETIVKQFWDTTFSGVYFKVLQTGTVQTGDVLEMIEKSVNQPTIAEVYETLKN
jgi:MOSC domain-containing protein YiiM